MNDKIKIGFDIGGVLSKYPDILRPIIAALSVSPDIEIHVLSDMHPIDKCIDWIRRNELSIINENIHSCDYAIYGEECKAMKAKEIGLHVLIDDFMGYISIANSPILRLFTMPDHTRDYYHESWKTDGSEGNFGRIKNKKN